MHQKCYSTTTVREKAETVPHVSTCISENHFTGRKESVFTTPFFAASVRLAIACVVPGSLSKPRSRHK